MASGPKVCIHISDSDNDDVQHQQPAPVIGANNHQENLIWRGPSYGGNKLFDHHFIFANDIGLKSEQCDFMNDITADSPGVPIKYYVYKMTTSTARNSKFKMKFSTQFTQSNPRPYLWRPLMINIECGGRQKELEVKMKIESGGNSAILSAGWGQAVEEWDITVGDAVMFCFFADKHGVLHLLLMLL